jgi:hypothetical protein
MNTSIPWQDIENELHTLEKAEHGYSQAQRGVITMPAGQRVFVKVGVDEATKAWAQKEIAVYEFLADHDFAHIPRLLSYNDARTSFALEALDPNKGWSWIPDWTEGRLDATLQAMDQLAAIQPSKTEMNIFAGKGVTQTANGWNPLLESPEKQSVLHKKFAAAGYEGFERTFDIHAMAQESRAFVFKDDSLVHYDVRADNCAWNSQTKTIKLIDWNWTQIGDRRFDLNVMLVHAHKAGLDVTARHLDRLDAGALQWLAGFWLNAAATPMWEGGAEQAHLRDFQLEAGVAALKLRKILLVA